MFGFRKCTEFQLMLTWNLQGFLQNQSLETILICIVVLCFPQNNIAQNLHVWWMYEIKRAKRLSHAFDHFISAQANLFTDHKKTGLHQYEPNIDILEQFVSKQWISLQLIHFLLLQIDDNPCMGSRLWIIHFSVVLFASSQYISTHFFAWPSISRDHVEMFASCLPEKGSFSFAPAEILDSNIFWNCRQHLCSFRTLVECNPNQHGQGMMLVLQIDFFREYFPHRIKILFLSSQFYVIHIHR